MKQQTMFDDRKNILSQIYKNAEMIKQTTGLKKRKIQKQQIKLLDLINWEI